MSTIFDIIPLSVLRKEYDQIQFIQHYGEVHDLEHNTTKIMLREFLLQTICDRQVEHISQLNARIAELESQL